MIHHFRTFWFLVCGISTIFFSACGKWSWVMHTWIGGIRNWTNVAPRLHVLYFIYIVCIYRHHTWYRYSHSTAASLYLYTQCQYGPAMLSESLCAPMHESQDQIDLWIQFCNPGGQMISPASDLSSISNIGDRIWKLGNSSMFSWMGVPELSHVIHRSCARLLIF